MYLLHCMPPRCSHNEVVFCEHYAIKLHNGLCVPRQQTFVPNKLDTIPHGVVQPHILYW